MRIFTIALVLLFALLQYTLWIGKNGIADYRKVSDEIAIQDKTNADLKARNAQMYAEIDD